MNDQADFLFSSLACAGAPDGVLTRLLVAGAFGVAIAGIYRFTRRPAERSESFPTTLVLLAVLIALVTQVIGESVARAFSLVGALSIVRFRTVVRDTRDTAFVIFAVVVGMAVGAHSVCTAGVGLLVTGGAAFASHLASLRRRPAPAMRLTVRQSLGADTERRVTDWLREACADYEPLAVGTIRQGGGVEFTYELRLRAGVSPGEAVRDLNRLEGVIGVECRRADLSD